MFNFGKSMINGKKTCSTYLGFVVCFLAVPALPVSVFGDELFSQGISQNTFLDHPLSPFSSERQSPDNNTDPVTVSDDVGTEVESPHRTDSADQRLEPTSNLKYSNHLLVEGQPSPSQTATNSTTEPSKSSNSLPSNEMQRVRESRQPTTQEKASHPDNLIAFPTDWEKHRAGILASEPTSPNYSTARIYESLFPRSWLPRTTVHQEILAKGTLDNLHGLRYGNLIHPDRKLPSPLAHTPYGEVPLVLNTAVARNVHYFQNGISDRFQEYLNRYAQYKDLVEQIFQEFGLPRELGYLSLVESGFNPRAYSRARAAGPWQFMKGTGRIYGLGVTWYVDERRDPIKSTVAAAHHLRDLYDRFGSWPLALAAYNAGEGKISRAIRRTRSRDFWKIRRTRYIRRETKEYVPRFIAATLIGENPEDYGFVVELTDPHQYEEVLINDRVHLNSVSKVTGISFDELRRLNPELRRSIIPDNPKGYYLKVPVGMKSTVEGQKHQFQLWTQPPPPPTKWYRVRRGDSLSVVAKRFGMSVRTLKNLNHLSGNLIRAGKRLRVRADDPPVNLNSAWYTVRFGDSLSTIAHRHRMSVRTLKNLNNLSSNLIHVGDKLRVRGKLPPTGETKWYRVRPGDSLWTIARRFSVTVTDLKILNNLTSSVIRVGRLLLVSQ